MAVIAVTRGRTAVAVAFGVTGRTAVISTAIIAATFIAAAAMRMIAHWHRAITPDRMTVTVDADEETLGVDRRSAGSAATDVDRGREAFPAMIAGFGFGGCAHDEGDGGEGGGDDFHD